MAQGTIQLLSPTVTVILVEDKVIPVDNIAWAGPETVYSPDTRTDITVLRVRLKSEGHIDLHNTSPDGFASLLAGAAF
jgi:hypothetical protein